MRKSSPLYFFFSYFFVGGVVDCARGHGETKNQDAGFLPLTPASSTLRPFDKLRAQGSGQALSLDKLPSTTLRTGPLTLPSPARGEGENAISSPLMGEE